MSEYMTAWRGYTRKQTGVYGWILQNLLSGPVDAILTIISLWLIASSLPGIVSWVFLNADFAGSTRADCTSTGACWVFTKEHMVMLFYGFYPAEEIWRPNLIFVSFAAILYGILSNKLANKTRFYIMLFALLIYPWIALIFLKGSLFGLEVFEVVETDQWGGFMLTMVLSVVGIAAAIPLGILLALGRRSTTMPIIRTMCIAFIEFWRGVPLITVLFMASVMLPLFFPEGSDIDKLARALIAITLFEAAYLAEVVRGGLQAIPKGQFEAADSLGMSYGQKMGMIILPQALKLVIPGIVNTCIALFKDTSLVSIIGLWDILNVSYKTTQEPEWLGLNLEAFAFAALVYWLCCFAMSRYSMYLENSLSYDRR